MQNSQQKHPAGAETERGGGFILYSMHSERRCVFPHKLGVLILQIPSSCWGFVFLVFLPQQQANFQKKTLSSSGCFF